MTIATTTMPAAPPLQRRYSVSGKTLPEDVGAVKSPLHALDTSVQSTSCGLCECGGVLVVGSDAPATVRTSSKRSATQLPSPSTPSSQELPTKIARLGLDHEHEHEHVNEHAHAHAQENEDVEMEDLNSEEESCATDPLPDERSDWPEAHDTSTRTTSHPTDWFDHDITNSSHTTITSPTLSQTETETETLPLPPNPPTLTLLNLPPELRHEIYLHLPDLVLPYPLIYCLSTFTNKKQHPLASVSMQIRSEALAIFYSYNTWIIKLEFRIMYDAFQDWIIRLGDAAQHLRIVQIAVRGRLFKPWTSHASSSFSAQQASQQQITNTNTTTTTTTNPSYNALLPHLIQTHPQHPQSQSTLQSQPLTPPPPPQNVPQQHPYHEDQEPTIYSPPDGDASFYIDLSEKHASTHGLVRILRNDGTKESGEIARLQLQRLVRGLWEKRKEGRLNGQDWVNLVDRFLILVGGAGW